MLTVWGAKDLRSPVCLWRFNQVARPLHRRTSRPDRATTPIAANRSAGAVRVRSFKVQLYFTMKSFQSSNIEAATLLAAWKAVKARVPGARGIRRQAGHWFRPIRVFSVSARVEAK